MLCSCCEGVFTLFLLVIEKARFASFYDKIFTNKYDLNYFFFSLCIRNILEISLRVFFGLFSPALRTSSREMALRPCRGRQRLKSPVTALSGGQIHSEVNSLRVELQAKGTSTVFHVRSAELSIAASTKASPLTPSSTVGKARSIWSGGSCRILATTALAKSE
jgi:hypothetical protein